MMFNHNLNTLHGKEEKSWTKEEDEVYRATINDDTHIQRAQQRSRLNAQPIGRHSGSGPRGGHVIGSGSQGG